MVMRMLPIHLTNAIAESLQRKIAFSDISQKSPPKVSVISRKLDNPSLSKKLYLVLSRFYPCQLNHLIGDKLYIIH